VVSLVALTWTWFTLSQGDFVHDAYAYWSINYSDPYGVSLVGRPATYLYSPAFAQAIWPATLLPWNVFASLWIGLNLVVLAWMARPWLAAVLLFIPHSPVTDEITTGNIHLLIAASLVIGLRYAGAFAFPLLTKLTPGVSVLWFAGARKWRALAVAVGITLGVSLVSFVLAPQAWIDWIDLLRSSAQVPVVGGESVIAGPLWLRTALAGALVVIGGRFGWRWTVPVAATLALPVVWSSGLSVLVALVPMYRDQVAAWFAQLGQERRYSTSLPSR
jgi:hypothetical protein